MSLARLRLMKDFQNLQEQPIAGLSATPTDNFFFWKGIIIGPPDTPYEDGSFFISMNFPQDYPMKPPTVNFLSIMFHPNVYPNGAVCLDILDRMWSSMYDVSAILQSVRCLLGDPNPNSPANAIAANMLLTDHRAYRKEVLKIVERSYIYES